MAPIRSLTETWNRYVSSYSVSQPVSQVGNSSTLKGMNYYELKYDDNLKLRYTFDLYGEQPTSGYPLFIGLHGGGASTTDENDGEWRNMWRSDNGTYGDNVKNNLGVGVYIAARGITDDWDLHFRPQTYFLLQRLIRNLLFREPVEAKTASIHLNTSAQHFIDANRIYLLGFSAGGDGVYRLATVLSDRFAAVNMSAGHPGNSKLGNLANVPICLQVGEQDGDELIGKREYKRNAETVKAATELDGLRRDNPNHYVHDFFMHPTAAIGGWAHNSWRHDELTDKLSPVFRNWSNFRSDKTTDQRNTCAVLWVSRKDGKDVVRNPLPSLVVWDISLREPESEPVLPSEWGKVRFYYWLAVEQSYRAKEASVRASYNRDAKEIWIEKTPTALTILLNDTMMDLGQPVNFFFGPQKKSIASIRVTQDATFQDATLRARGDPNLIFSAVIVFDPASMTVKDRGAQRSHKTSKL